GHRRARRALRPHRPGHRDPRLRRRARRRARARRGPGCGRRRRRAHRPGPPRRCRWSRDPRGSRVRAVNLIPSDERRGAGGAAGRTGGLVYVVLGALALAVAALGAYVLLSKSLDDKKSELAKVTVQAQAAEAHAAQLSAYQQFASLRQSRVETVQSI